MKTEIEEFILDAIKGKWGLKDGMPPIYLNGRVAFFGNGGCSEKEVLLEPSAWQAVGKTRGWRRELYENGEVEWQHIWHRFIDHLADGKTIEEALLAIK